MDSEFFSDESIGWPSYVDFFSTFAFVLIIFIGSLLFLLSIHLHRDRALREELHKVQLQLGKVRTDQEIFERRMKPFLQSLTRAGINNKLIGTQVYIPLDNKIVFKIGEWQIGKDQISPLREVAKQIHASPVPITRITVKGYADRLQYLNDPFGNWRLSADRALSILQFFYLCADCSYDLRDVRSKLTLTGEGDVSSAPNIGDSPAERRVDVILDYRP